MKINKILSACAAVTALLGLAACADTDAQYEVTPMEPLEYVSATPDAGTMMIGENTITVQFNENIGFASANASKITFDGEPVESALVLGASNTLTITVNAGFGDSHSLHIPAGLVMTADKQTYDKDIDLSWALAALPSNDATKMTEQLGWGWNLGNHFDTSDVTWGYWDGATPTQALYTSLAAAGVKTVRIPVTWTCHYTNKIDGQYMDEVAQNVDWALGAGLNVILNTHHDNWETKVGAAAGDSATNAAYCDTIKAIWTQVATKFGSRSDKLIFETFNEVHDGDNWSSCSSDAQATLTKWNQVAVDAIRANEGSTKHWIGVPGYAADIDLTIANPTMPEDSANKLIVAVHSYSPYNFCLGGGNTWGHTATGTIADEKAIMDMFYKLRSNYIDNNIPVYLGEFGCSEHVDQTANLYRMYYFEFFCRAAQKFGIPMMIWDNMNLEPGNESHGYFNHNDGSYVRNGSYLIPMMITAYTSKDSSYDMQSIYDRAPQSSGN